MNIVYVTTGAFLRVFGHVHQKLATTMGVQRAAFYATDRAFFESFAKEGVLEGCQVLKEWEIVAEAAKTRADTEMLRRIERDYFASGSFWKAFQNDRRIYMGPYCKVTQDYGARFDHEAITAILQVSVLEIEKLLDSIAPDVMVACNAPTTFGEYLLQHVAKVRGIRRLILRPTKIGQNCAFTDDYLGNKRVEAEYLALLGRSGEGLEELESAREYVAEFRRKGQQMYEGSVGFTLSARGLNPLDLLREVRVDLRRLRSPRDHHRPGSRVVRFYYDRILRYGRWRVQNVRFRHRYVTPETMRTGSHIFFPLHAEPEIATTLFSNQTDNQLELIRNIGLQLPAEYRLLVKEHPRCVGRRPSSYYEKILRLPNVDLAPPSSRSIDLMKHSDLVIAITGFAGLEATFNQKPVITLGSVPYNMLPKHMVNHVVDLGSLYREIRWSIENYRYDEPALLAYVAANRMNSVSIHLYSVLLGKRRSMAVERTPERYEKDLEALSGLLMARLRELDEPGDENAPEGQVPTTQQATS